MESDDNILADLVGIGLLFVLFIKAVDARQGESSVTDIPFVVDAAPPVVRQDVITSRIPGANDSLLRLTFPRDGGGRAKLTSRAGSIISLIRFQGSRRGS